MASSFRTNNLIVSGTMSGNGHITEIDTLSLQGNAGSANYWIKVAECISNADDKAQATIYVSLEGKAGDVRCGGIVYLRHGGSTGYYDISVDLINPPNSPNTQDNTDFVLTYDSSATYKSQLWVRSNETFQKCYATIIDGTRQPNENYVNFYELTPGSTWVSSITSLGADLTATYTNRTFNDLSISSVTSILDLKDGLIVTGNIYVKNDSNDGFNIGTENTFMLSAQGSIRMVVDNDNDTANGYFSVEGPSNAYNFVSYDDGKNYLNFSKNALGDFWYRGGNSESLLHVDAGENSVAIGASEFFPFSSPGIGQDVLIYLSGSKDTKDSSTRGITLIAGDAVVSGSTHLQNNLFLTGNIYMTNASGDEINWESESDFVLTAQNSITLKVDNDNDSSNAGVKIVNNSGITQHIFYEDGRVIFNSQQNSAGALAVRGSTDYGLLITDLTNNIAGLGSFTNVLTSIPGLGNDVKVLLSGSTGTKDSATRGVTLVSGDMVVSGTIYNGSGVAITGDITEITAGTGLTGGGVSGNITLSTNDAAIVHDNLSGFVSNEHIDHSTVSIAGNNGISGGGDLTSSRTLSLDFSSLTDMTGDISATTEFILQDGSTESRKAASEIKLSNFNNDSGWTTNTGTVTSIGLTEGNLIDISGGPITTSGNITVSVDLSELTPSTSDGDGDFFVVVDSANAQKKLTKANINLSGFNNDLSLLSLSNGVNNNIVTATGASGLNGESNLTFSGTLLTLNGFLTGSSGISIQNSKSNRNGINIHNSVSAPNVAFNTEFGADLRENAINGIGTDVGVLISGSAGGKDGVSKEVALVTGDMVISGTLYDGLGKSYIKDIEKGSFQTALASNQKQYLPGDDSSNEQSSIQYYSFVTAPFSGSFDKIILKAWSTTSFGQLSDLGGITASFHRGDNGSDPLDMSSSPSFTEDIKVDLSSHPQNDYLEIVFSGSNFNPGDSYALGLQPDNNWNAGGTLNLNYTIVTSYKLN